MASFLIKLSFLSQINVFFRNLDHHWTGKVQRESFSGNPGHNVLELFHVLVLLRLATSKN